MKRVIIIIISICVFLLITAPLFSADKITIVYTNSLNGNLDYCHCRADPRGGLVKRSTEIKKIRSRFPSPFLFETGDFFLYDKDPLLAKYLIRGYKHIRYDAVMFGDQEFTIGIDEFLAYKKVLPFVNNNLMVKSGSGYRRPFKRSIIIKKGNIKAGVIGSISKDAFKFYPRDLTSGIRVLSQEDEIKKDIALLKKRGAAIIILLSHSGYDADRKLSGKIRGLDVIIGGHSQTLLKTPVYNGKTIIVQAGSNGAHIGILELKLDRGKIVSFKNSFRRPDEFQPADDPVIRKMISEYQKEVKKKYKKLRFN